MKPGMNIGMIVAAGRGHRFGGSIPKQYRELDEQPIIRHTAVALLRHPAIDAVQIMIHPSDRELYERATEGLRLLPPLIGGSTRQESVYLGLEGVAPLRPEKVLIHDAVRPFVEQETITAVLDALDRVPCAVAALPVVDTLKQVEGDRVTATVDRSPLWRAQTPQGFRFAEIIEAHRRVHRHTPLGPPLTDDAMVAERTGLPVALVRGTEDNLKITTELDFLRAEIILQRGHRETHIGWGFDSQTTVPGGSLTLCGILVTLGAGVTTLQGRDVALNAVVSAMLGTVGGIHNEPARHPSLANRRLANPENLVRDALSIVAMAGGRVEHIDVTIIADHDDILLDHADMVRRLAALLSVPLRRISVRHAGATEIGLMLRGSAIAAQSIATINFPADVRDNFPTDQADSEEPG